MLSARVRVQLLSKRSRLPVSRLLSSSARAFAPAPSPPPPARAPTFTTPEVGPTIYAKEDATKPLPPTDLPIEDYASPLLHTASLIGTFFRYAVFTSVGVVVLTLSAFAGVHIWVEKVELAGPTRENGEDDSHGWAEELEGWSGAHRGGGTDPRLGLRARMAVRSAWIGQSWGGGIAASPVSTAGSSPFAAGGAMIGASKKNSGKQVGDAGWQMAEGYLVYALTRAAQKGISLGFSDPEGSAAIDRAAVELEERLAGVRERMGGRYKLEEAAAGWERIYYAVSATSEPTGWEKRERIRATKKLGEISARLAALEFDGSEEKAFENTKAEGWFLGGLLPALTDAVGAGNAEASPTTKVASPFSSFFGFWSHSHPPAKPSVPSSVQPDIANVVRLVDQASASSPLDPVTSRTILASLVSLETFLARTRNVPAAEAVQRSALSFAHSLHHSPAFSTSPDISSVKVEDGPSPSTPRIPWTDPSWVSPTLDQLSLRTRTSLLVTHLAEVTLASYRHTEPEALGRLQGAINDCDAILAALSSSPLLHPTTGLARVLPSQARREFEKAAADIVRDARLTGSMAARLTAYVHEAGCGSLARGKKGRWGSAKDDAKRRVWCGGDASAEAFYAKAMEYSEAGGKVLDEKGYIEAEVGFRRAKGQVLREEREATV